MRASFALRQNHRLLIAVVAALALSFGLAPAVALKAQPAAAATCPCTIWPSSATPASAADPDTAAVEVGVKFRSDVDGYITGLRFYKGTGNTGTHIGHLWSRSGALLATATFTGESATGWQQVTFSSPAPVSANTTYVASYYAPNGRYAADDGFFSTAGVDNAPLHALRNGVDGGNGVYRYGTGGGFPTNTFQSANYWVDVVFTETAADTTPPTVTSRSPAPGATNVPATTTVSATFSEPIQAGSYTFELRGAGGTLVPSTTSYDASGPTVTLTPNANLASATQYTASLSGARDLAGNTMAPLSWTFTTASSTQGCPCTIWPNTATPAVPSAQDASAVELGVKFRASSSGFVTGLRFYKGSGNTGTHVGHLWTAAGSLLATVTFTGESATGWQQMGLSTPVAVTAGQTYVASYHTNTGFYAADNDYFAGRSVSSGPLTALADGQDGPNGVYVYGAAAFPTNSFQSSNYWVDVVYDTTAADTTPPTVTARTPAPGDAGVPTSTTVTATFSEPVQPATINFQLTGPGGAVSATTAYDASTRTATLTPAAALANSTTYTASLSGARDSSGNTMAPVSWTFTTAAPPGPPPEQGPGGPVLILRSASAPFSAYTAEILRAEGLNSFASADIGAATPALLSGYDVVLLAATTLTAAQVTMVSDWVSAGGNLIAFRPDKQLATLLGLTATTGTLSNAYLKVDTASAPGAGITSATIQFHNTADRYTLAGARAVATLYSSATAATANPAVSLVNVGVNGGQAAAFTYDLPRSIVYTRQGNPSWAGQERDGVSPIRPDDLYFGGSATDWVDLNKVEIPQADEQQRLLANLIESMNADRKPLPRFWYFPRSLKAVVVATGDDHGNNGTQGRFDQYAANSAPGCVVADWQCLRFSSYIYPGTPLSNSAAAAYAAAGFEIGLHPQNGCANFTASSLESTYTTQLGQWRQGFPSLASPRTNRFHCLVYSDWATQPITENRHGIRMDTNYYYWPPSWIQDRPGFMTGSGMPMRFANTNGAFIDVFQAATSMTDESGQSYPFTPNRMLDNALGPLGYYGAFTVNMHTDHATTFESDQVLASAMSRGVPLVTAQQLLDWTDGRNGSSFSSIAWNGGTLSFSVAVGAGANGITGMLPTVAPGGAALTGITRGGSAVSFTRTTIKGIEYAMFSALPGDYVGTYATTPSAPAVSALGAQAAPTGTGTSTGTATVNLAASVPATAEVSYGASPQDLERRTVDPVAAGKHRVVIGGLAPGTTYYYRVTAKSPAGKQSTWPAPGQPPATLRTPPRDGAAPVVARVATLPLPDGTAEVSWTTREPADSQVLFGTSPGALTAERHDRAAASAHSVVLTALRPDTTYWYRVVTRDAAGNMTTWPAPREAPASFVTSAAGVADRDAVQFRMGRGGDSVGVQQDGYGELAIAADGTAFATPRLPGGWTVTRDVAGATQEFAAGALALDGATAGPAGRVRPGRALDARVAFSSQSVQQVGLAAGGTGPSAQFVAKDGSLSAVSVLGRGLGGGVGGGLGGGVGGAVGRGLGARVETPLPADLLDAPHQYRIEITGAGATFLVDGQRVASRAGSFPAMRAVARDLRADGTPLSVRALRVPGTRTKATFLSRVLDAGSMVTWDRAGWQAALPTGTRVRVSVRIGSTPTPDATWSAWQPLSGPGARVVGDSRYLQYRVEMSSRDASRTPTVRAIGFTHNGKLPAAPGEIGPIPR